MKTEEANKLGLLITHFGASTGVVRQGDVVELEEEPLKKVLLDTLNYIRELEEQVWKIGKIVDIFWDRQGWYIVEVADPVKISVEHPDINSALKSAAAQGYIIRDVRRTRGHVQQPKVPLPERKLNDAE